MPLRREGSSAEEEDFAVLGIGITASFSIVRKKGRRHIIFICGEN
jgi:hypothetical protein